MTTLYVGVQDGGSLCCDSDVQVIAAMTGLPPDRIRVVTDQARIATLRAAMGSGDVSDCPTFADVRRREVVRGELMARLDRQRWASLAAEPGLTDEERAVADEEATRR